MWTTPTQVKMQTQASTQGINKFSFSWVHLRSLPTRVNRWKLNHCRPSCKDTSTALAYLSFLVFALDLDNVSYMLSRSVFISRRSTLLHKKMINKIKGLRFGLFCSTGRKIRDVTRWREFINFLFEWQEQYLTSKRL